VEMTNDQLGIWT